MPTDDKPTKAPAPYEPPTVTPVGNLHDLLTGASGTQCDAATGQFDNTQDNC